MQTIVTEFSEDELALLSSYQMTAVIKDLRGSFRLPAEVRRRTNVSIITVNKAINLGLDVGYLENQLVGGRYKYRTTKRFDERYCLIKKLPVK